MAPGARVIITLYARERSIPESIGSAKSGWRARAARAAGCFGKLHAKSHAQKVLGLCRRCRRLWQKPGGGLPADRSRQGGVARGSRVCERRMGFPHGAGDTILVLR